MFFIIPHAQHVRLGELGRVDVESGVERGVEGAPTELADLDALDSCYCVVVSGGECGGGGEG